MDVSIQKRVPLLDILQLAAAQFPLPMRTTDEGMANVTCRSISAVIKQTVHSQLDLYKN